jgi:receptor expression-enhancing protein 5/6
MEWLWRLVMQLSVWAGPLVTFWYPVIASFVAIGSGNKADDKLWITYWMLYSLVSTLELIAGPVFAWVPFYSTVKLVVASWLVLPQFRGAVVVYEDVVRPYFNLCFNRATEVTFTDGERTYISPDTNASAALYIQTNGPEAFEALMNLATKSTNVDKAVKVEKIEEVEETKE